MASPIRKLVLLGLVWLQLRNSIQDINKCEFPTACHKDAYCNNYRGSYNCTCVSGYNGNGTVCLAPEKCKAPLDLIFLLDASGSVQASNYIKEKEFIKVVVSRYDVETVNKAAVIVFSAAASNVIPMGSETTPLSFALAVDGIPYDASSTRIDLALRLAYDEYFSGKNANETQKLIILLTDGIQTRSNSMSPAYIPIEVTADLLRSKSARIIAVTIGKNINMTAMRTVTEREEDIFRMTEFNELVANADIISKKSCVNALQTQGISFCSVDPSLSNCQFPAYCVNATNNTSCVCSPGYLGDPPNCEDINECTDGTHDCHISAYCVNIPGSYNCSCKLSGYSYNGSICVDVDECAQKIDNCDVAVSECINTQGSYICSCLKEGYAWNESTCIDVDECKDPERCADAANCTNLDGSYDCYCSEVASHLCFGTTLCDTPRVSINDVGRSIDQPTEVQLSSYHTFTANIAVRCAKIWIQNMSWILADPSLNNSDALLNGSVVSTERSTWTLTDHHLQYAHVVYALFFSFTVLQGNNNLTHSVFDRGYIIIRPSQLVATISGETEVTRGNEQIITLNGSDSYDPHVGHGSLDSLTFFWLCKRSDEEFPTRNPNDIQIVPILSNQSGKSLGGCFGTGIGRLAITEPVITLNASTMENTSASYIFKLIVMKDARLSSDSKTIHVVEGSPPAVSFVFVMGDRLNVNPSAPLTISADYLSYSCVDRAQFEWFLYQEDENLTWIQIYHTPERSQVFSVDPKMLKNDTKYRLELTLKLKDEAPSKTVQVFRTAVLPQKGSCVITPETGEAVYTVFQLQCFDWFVLDEVLTYEVQVIGEENIHLTLYYGLNASQHFVLPQGNSSRGYVSKIKVFVSRSNGATSEVDITVKVTPPQLRMQQDFFEFLENSSAFFEDFIFEEGTQKAWQLMTAMLLTLEKQEFGTRNFSGSATPSQLKSALRDIALKRFQRTEVDLSSAVFLSAFVASAGKKVTELSLLSKDLLPNTLESIAALLLSKAKEKNADDERMISQGVYNSLFGTVELMMVSAEAAAIGKEGKTLSSEQLKAKDNVLKSMDITRTLLTTVAVRSAVSQSPKTLRVPGMSILVGRESSCGLQERSLNLTEKDSFRLPRNMSRTFANESVEWAEYQMIKTSFNPYRWHESYHKVISEVLSLEFTNDKGVLPVGGEDVDIDIKIPLNPPGNSSYDNNYFVRPQNMRYHIVELAENSDSIILEVQPVNESLSMTVFVKLGERPTVNNYNHMSNVPDFSSCSWDRVSGNWLSRCLRSPYQVMSTKHFKQTGLYYVGVLYVARSHDQLNHTRTRRSCNGKRRQRRDCVEPKPPPVKGIEYNKTLIYNPFTDENYTIKVRKYSCYYFALTQDKWSKDGCKVGDETNDHLLHCRCNHLTGFGGGFVFAPNPIDFNKVLNEFTRLEETENYVVLATVSSIFGVFVLMIIWARRADVKDERKLGPTVHVKPNENGTFMYEFTVVTGVWRNAGTTSNVFVKIYGTEGILEFVNLTANSPPGRKMFARGNIEKFVFHLENSLGVVVKIELWHDNSGKNSSWFLDQAHLVDVNNDQRWDFFHHSWLCLHKGSGSLKATIKSADPGNETRSFKTLFYSVSSVDLAEHHLWASVITRPLRNQFSRVQRASCCLGLLCLAMVCNAMFYQVNRVPDESIQIGPLQMSLRRLIIGIKSSLIIAPLSLIITGTFRYRKIKRQKQRLIGDIEESFNVERTAATRSRWCSLPYSFLYIAWFLCLSVIFVSATITVFYSLQWGKQTANMWLASVVASCVQDIFFWQPAKVLTFTVLLILIFKRPKLNTKKGDRYKSSFTEEMKELRAYELRKEKFFGLARQFVAFMVFYLLLMIVAYGDKDHHRYLMTKGTRDGFTFFYKVNTGEKMWTYMQGKFVNDAYAGEWYNGQVEQTPEYIGNKVSMLIGMPRLRQLRIKEDSCQAAEEVETIIDKCYDFYSTLEEDTTRLYLPHWIYLSDSQIKWKNLSQLCPRPWRYSTAEELNNFPSWAQHHIYGGGGYVLDLGYDKPTAIRMMEGVKDKDWIDRRTRAILLEFQVLNLNTDLMSIITYYYEVLPFGFGLTYEKIDTIKMFNFQSTSNSFYLMCQLLFMLAVLVYISILLIRLCREGCAFFKKMWNWIDIAQIMNASLAIVFYVLKAKFMHDSIKELRRNPFLTVSFQFAIFWTDMENVALAFALFIATFKILHFIRLSPHVQILAWTVITAKNDILSFSFLFGILFIAHGQFAFLVFGDSVFSFSSFIRSFASEFELALGNTIHVAELDDVNRVLGNLFTASFMIALAVLLINIFVSILDFNLHNVKEDEERLQEAFGMGEFIKSLFGNDDNKQNGK